MIQTPVIVPANLINGKTTMIQTPVIVTFANQKGGVGKTSLCVTFANYLVMKGVRVVVIDCDFQHSILKCRKADLKHYGEELIPYEVWSHEPNSSEAMITLIEKLHNDPGIDVVLMDSPGSLKADGLVPMFVNSDIIAVPFHYDLVTVPSTASFLMFLDRLRKASPGSLKADGLVPMFVNSDIIAVPFHYDLVTVPSTASFLMFLDRLRKAVGSRMKAQLFIIPNLHDNRVGKRTELLLWDNTRDTFSNYGYVTSKIPRRADLQRFSTIAGLDLAQAAVTPEHHRRTGSGTGSRHPGL